jgi:hypothetical protein
VEQVIKYKLVIEVREDDKVYVTGPLHNKHICFAMLEEAKDIVKNAKKTKVFIPTIEDLKKLR